MPPVLMVIPRPIKKPKETPEAIIDPGITKKLLI